ncbi:protein LIFEGUARD 4 [Rosa chinensis]|uniref:protein LIFEGUARD 4 n=1 Tax=Rosa chinensis TaxID=74649 RepID=UPI000D091B14|nr:protein LIFEGUARD 4 [Rosa chinensis]
MTKVQTITYFPLFCAKQTLLPHATNFAKSWKKMMTPKINLEVGEILRHRRLYPSMVDSPELRWAFILKVYAILTVQLLLTIAVAATVDLVRPIAYFLFKTLAGLLSISPAVFKVILEAWGLTTVIFIGLTLYTFWATRRGRDFGFLGPFLFAALVVLLGFGLIQLSSSFCFEMIFHPLGKISHMIYGIVGCIIFCYYIVYDMDKLIKRHHYDDYMLAAIELYLDVIAASDS